MRVVLLRCLPMEVLHVARRVRANPSRQPALVASTPYPDCVAAEILLPERVENVGDGGGVDLVMKHLLGDRVHLCRILLAGERALLTEECVVVRIARVRIILALPHLEFVGIVVGIVAADQVVLAAHADSVDQSAAAGSTTHPAPPVVTIAAEVLATYCAVAALIRFFPAREAELGSRALSRRARAERFLIVVA